MEASSRACLLMISRRMLIKCTLIWGARWWWECLSRTWLLLIPSTCQVNIFSQYLLSSPCLSFLPFLPPPLFSFLFTLSPISSPHLSSYFYSLSSYFTLLSLLPVLIFKSSNYMHFANIPSDTISIPYVHIYTEVPAIDDVECRRAIKRLQDVAIGVLAPLSELNLSPLPNAVAVVTLEEIVKNGKMPPLPEGAVRYAIKVFLTTFLISVQNILSSLSPLLPSLPFSLPFSLSFSFPIWAKAHTYTYRMRYTHNRPIAVLCSFLLQILHSSFFSHLHFLSFTLTPLKWIAYVLRSLDVRTNPLTNTSVMLICW